MGPRGRHWGDRGRRRVRAPFVRDGARDLGALDSGIWVGANPLVVCDVADHALAKDYPRREEYVGKFIDRIDWNEVAKRYKTVDRM